jgi:hypothetical protein
MIRDAMTRVEEWPQDRDMFVSVPTTEVSTEVPTSEDVM